MINVLQAMIITTRKDGSDADLLRLQNVFAVPGFDFCPVSFEAEVQPPAKSLCGVDAIEQGQGRELWLE